MFPPGPRPASYMPVAHPSFVGAQTGEVVKNRRNSTPSAAARSMFGVRARGLPYAPMNSAPLSSLRNQTMLGRAGAAWCARTGRGRDRATAAPAPGPAP